MASKHRVIALILTVTVTLLCPVGIQTAAADNLYCIKKFDTGAINWSTGKVLATGKAPPEASVEGAPVAVPGSARAHAIRNIIAILKQIKITPGISVGEYASTHDIILAGIEKTAQDAVTTQQLFTSALDVELRMEAILFGGFLQLVLPDHIRQIPKISEQKPKAPKKTAGTKVPVNKILFTGLVVDARGLGFEPILYPTIVGEQGKAIYSSVFVSREFAVQYGVATFICDMEAALSSGRVGPNPLVFKALRRDGDKTGALVVSLADAKALERSTERHKFLKECRVVIVTD